MDQDSNGHQNGGCIIVELKKKIKRKRESKSSAASNIQPHSPQLRNHQSRGPELDLTGLSAQLASRSAKNFLKRCTNKEESLVSLVLQRGSRAKENAGEVQKAIEELLDAEGYDWKFDDPTCTSRILVYLNSEPSSAGVFTFE